MSGIRGVIFDLGNTLMYMDNDWDVVRSHGARDLVDFLTEHGFALDPSRFGEEYLTLRRSLYAKSVEQAVEYTAAHSLRTLLAQLGHEETSQELVQAAVRTFFAFEREQWKAYPQAEATLRELSEQGYRLALISNATDDELIQALAERCGLRKWFDVSLTSAGVGLRKPHPGIFQVVLKGWGFPPSQVVMVGDTLRFDIAGAHNAGLKAILAAWDLYPDYDAGADHVVPDATAESLVHLVDLIPELGERHSAGTA
jgi:HAD superfamily hydrolase (TIGR01662 family)